MKFLSAMMLLYSLSAVGQTHQQQVANETIVIQLYEMLKVRTQFAGETNCTYNQSQAICASYHLRIHPYSVFIEQNLRKIAGGYGAALLALDTPGWFQLLFFRRYGKLAPPKKPDTDFLSGMPKKEYEQWLKQMVFCSKAIEPEYFTGIDSRPAEPTGATLFTIKESVDADACYTMLKNLAFRVSNLTHTDTRVERIADRVVRLTQE